MHRPDEQQQLLDEIGGEPLEGSGFEREIPDPSFEMADANQSEAPTFREKGGARRCRITRQRQNEITGSGNAGSALKMLACSKR